MSDTPIFDQLVRDFFEERSVSYDSLTIPTRIKGGSRGTRPAGYVMDEIRVGDILNGEDALGVSGDPQDTQEFDIQALCNREINKGFIPIHTLFEKWKADGDPILARAAANLEKEFQTQG